MEEVTNVEENVVVKEQQPKEEKLFTQEEVDTIVKKRLGRVKEENSKELEEKENALVKQMEEKESNLTKQLEERENAIMQRETKLNCREYLMEQGYPMEMFDIIGYENVDDFKEKADKFHELLEKQNPRKGAPMANTEYNNFHDDSAFFNTKHEPRGKIKESYD